MSGFCFLLIIDWIMRHTVKNQGTGLRWKFTSKLEDLDLGVNLVNAKAFATESQQTGDECSRGRPSGEF